MDNLKYYNESLAYDFEMFMPKSNTSPKKKDNIIVMPKAANRAKARNAKAAKAISVPISMLLCCIVVLAGLCGNIALRLRINEVNDEIKSVKTQIAELDSEKTCLEMEMQRRVSFANLELEAVKLGMRAPEKEDVVYIKVNDKNTAKIADGSVVCEE